MVSISEDSSDILNEGKGRETIPNIHGAISTVLLTSFIMNIP